MEYLTWLVTPALIATILYATLPLYDPAVRWTRRLKSDIQIAAGLPDGEEKDYLDADIAAQARRLFEYRIAFTGRHLLGKYGFIAYFVAILITGLAWPPDPEIYSAADWAMFGGGVLFGCIYLLFLGRGTDIMGRTPRAIVRADRVRRYRKRSRRLQRINKARAAARASGRVLPETPSRLGFRSQVDELAEWVQTWEARDIATYSGLAGVGLADGAAKSLRSSGRKVPNPYI